MKTTNPSDNDQPLNEVLVQWKVESSLPPRFQEQVWRRIETAEARKPEGSLTVVLRWLDAAFRRPALALSYVTVLLFVGLGIGYWQAQDKTAQSESKWQALYVQSVDPYQAPRN
jgi:hypothetical protein